MATLFHFATPVKSGRPFAAGLDDPPPDDPDPAFRIAGPVATPSACGSTDTPGGDVECDPADWPDWTDAFTWESDGPASDDVPSPDDRAWAAAEFDRLASARVDHAADARAAESAALDALSAGLTPPDPAPPARPRRPYNPVTDADVARVGAVG